MKLKLVKLEPEYRRHLLDMMEEWHAAGERIGSAKSIRNNGGILENEAVVDGVTEQRYWIEIR